MSEYTSGTGVHTGGLGNGKTEYSSTHLSHLVSPLSQHLGNNKEGFSHTYACTHISWHGTTLTFRSREKSGQRKKLHWVNVQLRGGVAIYYFISILYSPCVPSVLI